MDVLQAGPRSVPGMAAARFDRGCSVPDTRVPWLGAIGRHMQRERFEKIFAEYAPRVVGYLRRHGLGTALVDEVTQEVLLTVWRESARFDPEKGSMSAWVFTIARNRLIDTLRRQRRPEPDENDPCWLEGAEDQVRSPEALAVELRRARDLKDALGLLPPEQRQVLESLYFEGRSMSEVAAATGIPLGTIKTRARLALRALRARLDGDASS